MITRTLGGRVALLVAVLALALVAREPAALAGTTARTAAATPYPGGRWAPPPASYGVHATRNVPVTMSDGVPLVADVYRPADRRTGLPSAGRFPVLLTQTPYNGSIGAAALLDDRGPGAYYVERGYVYVSVDVRGTGRSSGTGGFFSARDAQDGAELVDWVARLAGSNGVVGLHGCSYLGLTQVYTARLLRPGTAVRAMIPACTAADPYRSVYMVNGIHAPAWVGAGLLAGALLGPTVESYMVPRYLESEAGADPAYDGSFWGQRDTRRSAPAIAAAGIATLLWNGWDDSGFGGLELYTALQNAAHGRPLHAPLTASSQVSGRYRLLLGDWSHGGGLDEGVQLQWYETWLKGRDTGITASTRTPLHVQERVSGRWRAPAAYPFTASTTRLDLDARGALSRAAAPSATRSLRWAPPSTDGAILVYDSAPFASGATLAGPGALRVHVRTTASDVQLVADLLDVAPDGTESIVSHGGALGSMRAVDPRQSWTDDAGRPVRPHLTLRGEEPVTPGALVRMDVPLRPTLWQLRPGHRLRLRLAGQVDASRCLQKMAEVTTDAVACFPRAGVAARLTGATFTVDHGGAAASYLNLPLLPADRLPMARSGVTPTGDRSLPLDW